MQFVALHQAGEKGSCYYGHKRRNFAVQGTTLAQTFGVSIALLAIDLQ